MAGRGREYRISRILTVVAVVVLAAIVAYAGVALYYAAQIPDPSLGPVSPSVSGGPTLVLASEVSVTNPGPFVIMHVTAVTHVSLPDGSPLVASSSGPYSFAASSTSTIPVQLEVPMGSLFGAAATLLVNDAGLPYEVWANGTYAGFAVWQAHVTSNYSWGAPFYHLLVDHGVPIPETNGSFGLPLNLSFLDRSPISLNGSLAVKLLTQTGADCAALALQVGVGVGGVFNASSTPIVPADCITKIAGYLATWNGTGFSAQLPEGSVA